MTYWVSRPSDDLARSSRETSTLPSSSEIDSRIGPTSSCKAFRFFYCCLTVFIACRTSRSVSLCNYLASSFTSWARSSTTWSSPSFQLKAVYQSWALFAFCSAKISTSAKIESLDFINRQMGDNCAVITMTRDSKKIHLWVSFPRTASTFWRPPWPSPPADGFTDDGERRRVHRRSFGYHFQTRLSDNKGSE